MRTGLENFALRAARGALGDVIAEAVASELLREPALARDIRSLAEAASRDSPVLLRRECARLAARAASLMLAGGPTNESAETRVLRVIDLLVEAGTGFSRAQLKAAGRMKHHAQARQLAMFLARELTPLSLSQTARRWGRSDHTTVIHAARQVRTWKGQQAFLRDAMLATAREATEGVPADAASGRGEKV